MMWQTVRSAISRAEGSAHDAQENIEQAVADIQRAVDHLTDATTGLLATRLRMLELQKLGDEKGLDHEIPYERER